MEAAAGGLFTLVVAQSIKDEVTEVLQRPKFGLTRAEVEERLGLVWAAAWEVTPGAPNDGHARLLNDPKDTHVLPVVDGTFAHADLAARTVKLLVTGDGRAFRPGIKYAGFESVGGAEAWRRLREPKVVTAGEPAGRRDGERHHGGNTATREC